MKKIITLFVLILMIACGNKEKETNNKDYEKSDSEKISKEKSKNDYMRPRSTGRINHVVVVVENDVWEGPAGEALREVVKKPLVGLPQPEPQFNISTIPSSAFTKMFKNSRNILFLQLANQKVFKSSTNKYAQPQTILEIKAPTVKALIDLIHEKKSNIVNTFKHGDLTSIQKDIAKNKYTAKINTLSKLGIKMNIPSKYRMVMDTLGSFMWMRSHIAGGIASGDQTNNIIVYTTPLFDESKSILDQMIKNRDSIGKAYIRGNNAEKMYMITEAARIPSMNVVSIKGKKAYESRGTWEIFGAFNAGPFLNYSIVDEKNNRLIVVEGFNYAPSVNKRDFVFELEAILKSTKLY